MTLTAKKRRAIFQSTAWWGPTMIADPAAGLITAAALILPSKKLEDVTVDFLIRRMNEKSFAKGVNREQIKSCEQLGLSLEKFLEIALEAMKKISDELGL